MNIKKIIISILAITLICSMAMCIEKKSTLYDYSGKSTINVEVNGQLVNLPLRTTVEDALSTKLINTNLQQIKEDYNNHQIIYIEYDKNLPAKNGGISITDLVSKLKYYNSLVGNKKYIVDDSTFNNQTEINNIKNSNKTLIIKIITSNTPAQIIKNGNTYIIEGNSLKELDKGTTLYALAIYTNSSERYYVTL